MARTPHVALLIETSRSYTRNLLRGIRRYLTEHGPWSVFLELRAFDSPLPPWLPNWHGDGILCRSNSQAMLDAVLATGIPAVELRASKLQHNLPFVGVDNRALGQLVAEHLLARGFRHFGCFELDHELFFAERRNNFVETVAAAGHTCHCYQQVECREQPAQWERQQTELIAWLRQLPKPVGVLACTDQLGFWLLDACHRANLAVPEEVAVVGVEDDETLCEMATPPLSSVHFPGAKLGYAAAGLLAEFMSTGTAPASPILIPPTGVITRGSSDVVAIDDALVAQALRFIREHARERIQVGDVAAACGCSRSTLIRRMQSAVGRSPQAELVRVKLNLVRQLLVETDLPLEAVAHRAGFVHVQHLATLFRKQCGQTPGQYRKQLRLPES